jgi:LPS-assembly protein
MASLTDKSNNGLFTKKLGDFAFSTMLCTALVGIITLPTAIAHAAEAKPGQQPAEVEADQIDYNEKEATMTASGKVRVTQPNRFLSAEEVTYDQDSGLISAKENIHFSDHLGNHYYAESAEMNDQLSKGTISSLTGKLSDKSLIAAKTAERKSDTLTELNNASYSPCKVCSRKNNGKPLWQISADRVRIDQEKERITYKNATLDVLGFPVIYTPYLSHATPNAKRKSGFMLPTYSNISTLGFAVQTPYYINIAPNMDATFAPIITSQEGIILSGDFRHLVESGSYELKGSLTNPQKRDDAGDRIASHEVRGHFEGTGDFDFTEDWGWGFDVKHASDDTYLRRYDFGNEDRLTSSLFTDYIKDRNYMGARSVFFQGLNATDDPETTPLILPAADAHFESTPLRWGSRLTYDANILALSQDTGSKSRRISNTAAWNVPYATDNGHLLKLKTSLRGDIYHVDDVQNGSLVKDGFSGRAIPEAQVDWSYPLAGKAGSANIYIEPLANFIASPNGGNPNKIPNEDSNILELSDTNLFSNNHFTGLDRVEGGARTNYGVRGRVTHDKGELSFLAGQAYRATTDESFTEESGLNDNFSDYVGRTTIANKRGNINYRFRVDKDDFTFRNNEVSANVNFDPLRISTSYVRIDEIDNSFDRNEVAAAARLELDSNWSVNANGRRNLDDQQNGVDVGGWRSAGFGITYADECITINTSVRRDFVRDRDIEPSTTFLLQIGLKNLSEL